VGSGVTWFEAPLSVRRRAILTGMALVFVTLSSAGIAIAIRLQPLAALDGVLSLPVLILEDTAYADGYTHAKFRTIRAGMTETQVREVLGAPLAIVWKFQHPQPALDGGDMLQLTGLERVEGQWFGAHKYHDRPGFEMRQLVGTPQVIWWSYSRSPGSHSYRIRATEFRAGRVTRIRSEVYAD
jgi:hypothetical protein